MRRTPKIPRKGKPTFAVVADGETEKWYLEMLKRNEPDVRVNIRPQIPTKKKIKDQYEYIHSLTEVHDRVFWIVDLDAIIEDSKQVKNRKDKPLEIFKEYAKEFESSETVEVIVNNPCLEFWFLLHFEKTSKCFRQCGQAIAQLKKRHLPEYEKTQKFFKKQDNDIYLRLKDKLPEALKNSEALGKFNGKDPERAMCEMELFFELMSSIGEKIL